MHHKNHKNFVKNTTNPFINEENKEYIFYPFNGDESYPKLNNEYWSIAQLTEQELENARMLSGYTYYLTDPDVNIYKTNPIQAKGGTPENPNAFAKGYERARKNFELFSSKILLS